MSHASSIDFDLEWISGILAVADHDLLEECSALYSSHYGKWSDLHPCDRKGGKNVRLSPVRIKEWLQRNDAGIYCARANKKLIGYAIAIRCEIPNGRRVIAWVTQLVVHTEFRHSGVASAFLLFVCSISVVFEVGFTFLFRGQVS
jgi:hypothetical protein